MREEESYSIFVLLAALAIALAYGLRATRRGRARFERTDAVAGSPLLSRKAYEAGYWALQPLGNACVALGISANAITWMSLGFGIAGSVAVGVGRFGLGAIFALGSVLCDAIDGLVARKTGTSSDSGEVLDASIDRWNDFLLLAGLAFYYRAEPLVLVLALSAICGSFMVSYATAKAEALQVKAPSGAMRRPERSAYLIAGLVFTPLSRLYLEASFTRQVGLPVVFALGVIAIVSNVSSIRRFAAIARLVKSRPSVTPMEPPIVVEESDSGEHVALGDAASAARAPEAHSPSLDGAE
jgi:CDP-diacylglycerol--glycerol-3-phosphate 3-phosphatidyltransferase